MKTWPWLSPGLVTAALWLSACGAPAGAPAPPPPRPGTPEQEKIARLLNEILDLTRPGGCKKAEECKAVGLGYSACGPRNYVVYCPRSVDEAPLQQKLDELSKLEQAEAERQGGQPPCQPPPAPQPETLDGVCRAKI